MDDYQLIGTPLEKRVEELFVGIGARVFHEPRGSMEDFILEPLPMWQPQNKIVLEVKGKENKISPNTKEDLRQLDDRVFDLSGEMTIRRRTLNAWNDPLHIVQHIGPPSLGVSYVTNPGAIPRSQTHPIAIKGVMVFNGPANTPFDDRAADWLGPHQLEFAQMRSFCILSLPTLLSWVDACEQNSELCADFWRGLHETHGRLSKPPI